MNSKITKHVENILSYCCMAVILGLTIVVAAQVVTRAVGISLPWAEELARFMMIWLTFLGCSLALHRGNHLSVDFFVNLAPRKVRKVLGIVVRMIMILFFGVIVVYGFLLSARSMATTSSSLQWPMGLVYGVLPVSGVVSIYFVSIELLSFLRKGGEQ